MTRLSPIVETSGQVMRFGARRAIDPAALTWHGTEHLPQSGPVVVAVRHYHHLLDGLGLLAQVDRPLHIMVGLDWIATPGARRLMEGLARLCAWPVTLRDPEDDADDAAGAAGATTRAAAPSAYRADEIRPYQQRAFRQCVELLRLGRAVVIFPEGYPVIDPHRQRTPRTALLAPFKSGFARVAVAAARRHGRPVPVVPVGIRANPHDHRRLAFAYGAARCATGASDVDALIAAIRDDIAILSR